MKKLSEYKKVLIVVDMVNGFVKEGVLHDEAIARVIARQEELIKEYLEAKELVVFIKDTHQLDSTEFKRFGDTTHCLKGTSEAELVSELRDYEHLDNVLSISKNSTSFMESPYFRNLIAKLTGVERVEIVGCCTDICVCNGTLGLANYFDEWNIPVDIIVHEDAVETYGSPLHDRETYMNAAKLLLEQQGVKLARKNLRNAN